jgi:16S rRNA (uracil1498-N3)-methyltransferase
MKFIENEPNGYIGHCYEANKTHARSISKATPILIGPEGDFTVQEVEEAKSSGYIEIELSENRLRTETAALCAVFYLTNV